MCSEYCQAKKIYKKWYHSIDMMPEDVRKEFDSHGVPQSVIDEWELEYLEELYDEIVDYLNVSNEYNCKIFLDYKIIFRESDKNLEYSKRMVDLFKKFHQKGMLLVEMNKNDVQYDYFFKHCIICNKERMSSDIRRQLVFESEYKFCGFLDFLVSNSYLTLYEEMMDILVDIVKSANPSLNYFIKELEEYLMFINDEKWINRLKESLNASKI